MCFGGAKNGHFVGDAANMLHYVSMSLYNARTHARTHITNQPRTTLESPNGGVDPDVVIVFSAHSIPFKVH